MIADHLSSRVWVYDGEDRKVEIWLRHDGKFRVVRLHRLTGRKWREIDGVTVDDQFNAQAQAEHWRRLEEGRMRDERVVQL